MKIEQYIIVVAFVLLLAGLLATYVMNHASRGFANAIDIVTPSGHVFVSAEIVGTPGQWEQGLMFRKSLAENGGMLFVFPNEQARTFWMKNTMIPLDIIFIDSNSTIIDIKQNFAPCQKDPCETYTSLPTQYVLEVNAGFVNRNNITIGDHAYRLKPS